VREWPFRAKVVVTVRRQEASARGVLFSEIEEVLSQHLKELGKEDVRDVISSLNVPAIDGQPVAVAEVADVEIRLIRRDAGADDLRPAGQRGADRRYRDEGWFPARIMVCVQAERARAAGVSLQAAGRVLQQLAPNTEYCVDEIERLPLAGTDATPIPLARVAEVRIFVKVD